MLRHSSQVFRPIEGHSSRDSENQVIRAYEADIRVKSTLHRSQYTILESDVLGRVEASKVTTTEYVEVDVALYIQLPVVMIKKIIPVFIIQ